MIETIQLIDFQATVKCKSSLFQSTESFLPINYVFEKSKVYGLISDFGCGSWGLATCLCGHCPDSYTGSILMNGNIVHPREFTDHSCFVAEKTFPKLHSKEKLLSPKLCIEEALALSNEPYCINEIKNLFYLSDERFERSIETISGEIWFLSLAVNFAMGKQIFCFPWLNMIDVQRFQIALEHEIIQFLREKGKIILVPSSQKSILRRYCDHTLYFDKKRVIYH